MPEPYRIPSETHRTELIVVNSRFVTTIGHVSSVDEAKTFLANIRAEMPDASHHVYAFRIGYGHSVTEGMSDDGEPSGTSGPPVLAVLRGSGLGDVIVVVTRFFGGTKLGTGGLVRAYSEAVRHGLASLPTEIKIEKVTVGIEAAYTLYEQVKRLVIKYNAIIEDTQFETKVTLIIVLPVDHLAQLSQELNELSAGQITPVVLSE